MSRNKIDYKWLLLIVSCLFIPMTMSGQRNQLPRIDRAKMSIVNILKNLNYETQLKSGTIVFSDGKRTYNIDCSEETEEMFFGKLSMTCDYDEMITFDRVARFALNHNFKATKIVQNESGYSIRSEFYFTDPDYVYESVGLFLNTIKKAESMLKAKCQNYSEEKSVCIDSLKLSLDLESEIKSIRGTIVIDSNKAIGDTISVMVRVYCDNYLTMNDFSSDNYSFIEKIVIENDHQNYELAPWVLPEVYRSNSNLRYEIWDDNARYICSKEIKE